MFIVQAALIAPNQSIVSSIKVLVLKASLFISCWGRQVCQSKSACTCTTAFELLTVKYFEMILAVRTSECIVISDCYISTTMAEPGMALHSVVRLCFILVPNLFIRSFNS